MRQRLERWLRGEGTGQVLLALLYLPLTPLAALVYATAIAYLLVTAAAAAIFYVLVVTPLWTVALLRVGLARLGRRARRPPQELQLGRP